jgi:signal peptidase I
VLVLKYYYNFRPPCRGDVVVFKNPQDNRQNYIKRLVGLPGDRLQIVRGDLFIRREGEDRWHVWRKPADVQEAMWQVVYDNDYPPDPQSVDRVSRGDGRADPARWDAEDGAWDLSGEGGRRFHFSGGPPGQVRFRPGLRTFLPTYGYNTWDREKDHIGREDICGDLRLSVGFVPAGDDSELTLRIAAGGRVFEADVRADGRVRLQHTGSRRDGAPWTRTVRVDPLPAGRSTPVALAHADYGVRLWVGGRCVVDRHYDLDYELTEPPARVLPDGAATQPEVSLTGAGGVFDLVHVRLERDVYYTRAELRSGRNYLPGPLGDYAHELAERAEDRAEAIGRRIDDKQKVTEGAPGWATARRGEPLHLRKHPDNPDLDEFFVLGDNSPQSLDGRGWITASPTLRLYDEKKQPQYQLGTVPRYLLLGRALFVYWPSGYRLPGLPGLPFIPNVGRMRVIR